MAMFIPVIPGTGHFVKLVHNGIEFGMLQAIGEGVSLLHKGGNGFNLDLAQYSRTGQMHQ